VEGSRISAPIGEIVEGSKARWLDGSPSSRGRRDRSKNAWRRAELEPITLHEASHTFASLMIAAGVNAKALATYMGHASVTITYDRYGHLMPGNETEAAALLDAYLERADTQARLAQLGDPSS